MKAFKIMMSIGLSSGLIEPPERVWEEVGGVVEINGCLPENKGGWMNACTVRLSHMLNNAGHKLPRVRGQTVSGGTGNQYFFRLNEMRAYLKKAFGPADVELLDMSGKFIDMPELPGLLLMKFPGGGYTGHATLWNGAGLVDGGGVADTAVINVFVRPRQTPVFGVGAEVLLHIFVNGLLKIKVESGAERSDDHICANTCVGRDIAVWIRQFYVFSVIPHIGLRTFYCGVHNSLRPAFRP